MYMTVYAYMYICTYVYIHVYIHTYAQTERHYPMQMVRGIDSTSVVPLGNARRSEAKIMCVV